MADIAILPRTVIASFGALAGPAGVSMSWGFGPPVSAAWPSANRALYIPFRVTRRYLARQIFFLKGAAVSGNVDMGIYAADFTRLVSAGATAMAATASIIQAFDVSDTWLDPGQFFLALAMDNTTGTYWRGMPSNVTANLHGMRFQNTAFPLPAVMTPASGGGGLVPIMAVTSKTVV